MKKLLLTENNNIYALIARVVLGITIFPHGAQKLLGWFGGGGFEATMNAFTNGMNLPYIIALLVILIEFFGSLFLIFGFLTRLSALGIIANFLGVVFIASPISGFFMNWQGQPDTKEGAEYFIMLFGLAIIPLIAGGGKWCIDSLLIKKLSDNNRK